MTISIPTLSIAIPSPTALVSNVFPNFDEILPNLDGMSHTKPPPGSLSRFGHLALGVWLAHGLMLPFTPARTKRQVLLFCSQPHTPCRGTICHIQRCSDKAKRTTRPWGNDTRFEIAFESSQLKNPQIWPSADDSLEGLHPVAWPAFI